MASIIRHNVVALIVRFVYLFVCTMIIFPFPALHPRPQAAARVASVPYDVVDRHEARMLAAGNRDHFLHVTRPEIDFPDTIASDDSRVYDFARDKLADLVRRGVMVRDSFPRFYACRQAMGQHSQTGLVAAFRVRDYAEGLIRLHEKTRREKEDDRTRHTLATKANTGPVFLMFRDQPDAVALLDAVCKTSPMIDFTASDSVQHTVWGFSPAQTAEIQAVFASLPACYVADGHHRAAAACRAAEQRRCESPRAGLEAPCERFMAALFPASRLQVLPYHRVVNDLCGQSPRGFLDAVGQRFHVQPLAAWEPPVRPGQAGMRIDRRWYRISWTVPTEGPPETRLDVAVLQSRLLSPLLKIEDPRTDSRIQFVGGIRGHLELEKRVDARQNAVAFAMHPVSVDQIMDVADRGGTMPPKSTWFEPKLRSGLLVQEFTHVPS